MIEITNKKCSIVIRCFNEEQHIGRLLTGIMGQTLKEVEIILVDSGSTDATLSIASKFPVKIITIAPEEFSFGRSLNLGCAQSSGEFIVIVSAHTYPVYKNWLENLLGPFKDPKVALVYGKQRGGESAEYAENQIYKKWYPDNSINHQKYPFCNNANAAIRRKLWEKFRYNEELTGLEDLDWAKRVTKEEYKIVYCAEAEIIHVHHESRSQIYNRYRREAIAFKRVFPEEKFDLWDFIKLLFTNVFFDFYHAWHERVMFKNFISIISFRSMHFWGTYKGFQQRGYISEKLRNRFYYPNILNRNQATGSKCEKEERINYGRH